MDLIGQPLHWALMAFGVGGILWGAFGRRRRWAVLAGVALGAAGLGLFVREGRLRRNAARRLDQIRAEQQRKVDDALKRGEARP
jgi:hypothetical protein